MNTFTITVISLTILVVGALMVLLPYAAKNAATNGHDRSQPVTLSPGHHVTRLQRVLHPMQAVSPCQGLSVVLHLA